MAQNPKAHGTNRRIGIYAGAFDPVHAGHVAFALQAMKAARLDQVVFMPERRPRYKPGVEHYAHRVAMIKAACRPHPDLSVMEVVDKHFTVKRTLSMLQSVFEGSELILLTGSDTALSIPAWPYADQLLTSCELVVGVRSEHQHAEVERQVGAWEVAPLALTIFDSFAPHISSTRIREALRANQSADGLLVSVHRYAREQWLYVSPGDVSPGAVVA